MSAKDSAMTMGLERLNALLGWWGISNVNGNSSLEGQVGGFKTIALDLQKAYAEASEREMKATLAANERLAHLLQKLLHSRNPQEVMTAQSDILTVFLEGVSRRARAWTDLMEEIQARCMAMTRNLATEVSQSPGGDGVTKPSAKRARQVGQRSRAHLRTGA